jgi:hypothetical protein
MNTKPASYQAQLDTLNKILDGLNDQLTTLAAFEHGTNKEWNQFRNNAAITILRGVRDWSRKDFGKSLKDTIGGLVLQNPTNQGLIDCINQLEQSANAKSLIVSVCDKLISELTKTDIPATETPKEYVRRRLQEELVGKPFTNQQTTTSHA